METGISICSILTIIWFIYMLSSMLKSRKSRVSAIRLQPSSCDHQQKINISLLLKLQEKIISIKAKKETITIGDIREKLDEVILKTFQKINVNITFADYYYQIFKNKTGETFKQHNSSVNNFVVFVKIFSKKSKLIGGITDYIPVNLTIDNCLNYFKSVKN